MKRGMRKLVMMVLVMALTFSLAACGDEAQEVSDRKYQEILDDMGIEGVESVLDNVTFDTAFRNRITSKDYKEDNEFPTVWKELSELCGEQKDYDYYGCYGLGEDQETAEVMREEYASYLQEQGYEYQGTNSGFGDIYLKDGYAVMVQELMGPVSWSDKTQGQYGLIIWLY